jgi:poly-gamma-glutamate synthesis protein (capsule biosynthesis protein)
VAGTLAIALGTGPVPALPPGPAPPPASPRELASVRILAVGDIMMHQDVQASARQTEGGLQALWADVEPLLAEADLAFANLETPVAPDTGGPGRPFQFNAPADLPAALRASGFTVLSVANNHSFDQGAQGLLETLDRLARQGLVAVGAGATRALAEQPRIVQVKGLRVAFLGFTDVFNVNLDRSDQAPWVCPLEPAAAEAAVRQARERADAVVVSVHWGSEYSHQALPRQREVAARLVEAGADLVLGHHPHVLQPVEWLERGGRRGLVAYSLGNFISNQDRDYRAGQDPAEAGDSRDGVALQCRLAQVRRADGSLQVQVRDLRCEPLWTLNNWNDFSLGRARRREIRVTPVGAALARLRPGEAALGQALAVRRGRAFQCLGVAAP